MSKVHADPERIAEFRRQLIKFNRAIEEEFRRMKGQYNSVGEAWKDAKYQQFGRDLDEATRGIDQYLKSSDEYERHLAKLIDRLREFLET